MSGPLRLQVQAGGAFLSRVNVLRVMRPAQGFQVRILAPARLGHEAIALGSARPEARTARAPGGRTGTAGSRGGSHRSPGARQWKPGGRAQPAARPNPRPGRGAGWADPPRPPGPPRRCAPPRSSWHSPDPAACVGLGGTRVIPKRPRLGRSSEASRGWARKALTFLGNVSTERSF